MKYRITLNNGSVREFESYHFVGKKLYYKVGTIEVYMGPDMYKKDSLVRR